MLFYSFFSMKYAAKLFHFSTLFLSSLSIIVVSKFCIKRKSFSRKQTDCWMECECARDSSDRLLLNLLKKGIYIKKWYKIHFNLTDNSTCTDTRILGRVFAFLMSMATVSVFEYTFVADDMLTVSQTGQTEIHSQDPKFTFLNVIFRKSWLVP